MELAKLHEEYLAKRHDPNYQHRDLEDTEFMRLAEQAFSKLPPQQQEKVWSAWQQYGDGVHSNMIRYRYLAQTNLFFLCHILEKYNQATYHTHEYICNGFFVAKDPSFLTFEQFANQYTDLKRRMLLVPRNGFKSSLDMADCVQYIICYPEITILIMTGTLVLATDFVGEVKGHFTLEPTLQNDSRGRPTYRPRNMMDKITGAWTPSMFQVLFAEHCVPPDEGKKTEFNTPACSVSDKEPSVRAASIEQTLSGMHFGVLKLDDVVTNENSTTPTRISAVNKQISINRGMLNPYGFVDVIGTWYDEHDFYGETLKNEEKRANEDGKLSNIIGTIDSGRFDSSVVVKTHLRACWWPNEEAKKQGKIEAEMTADDYVYWFPERLTYEFLKIEQQTDEFGFAIKYLNNPRVINRIKFPRELMVRKTIPSTMLPHQGMIVTVIDTAYSTQSWADYTVIITALIYGGRFYVVNMRRGRYNEYQLPAVIAEVGQQWKPKHISIEESVGVGWLQREIRREMTKLQISIPVQLVSLGKGSKSRNKAVKAKPLARLLGDDRFYFTTGCEGLADIYNELEQFTGTKDDKHDDIVSALSLLVEQYGAYAEQDGRVQGMLSQQAFVSERQSAARHRLIHGLGEYSRYNASNDDNPQTAFDVGQSIAQAPAEPYSDPLLDAGLF